MKDWKTYAVIILAAWCAWLTFRSQERDFEPQTFEEEHVVDELARDAISILVCRGSQDDTKNARDERIKTWIKNRTKWPDLRQKKIPNR